MVHFLILPIKTEKKIKELLIQTTYHKIII